ncbi:MFS transporter [Spirosoma sp. BT702]|uniref:MFS transporter n=1 Tax=Spirosoma profusum TaxID=2771354 RepID=A0A927APB1_9BACT|nr:MFS transporter [Spirosoma profusum]MBD2703769.1 MFS transporter [Spirosoma profusum]
MCTWANVSTKVANYRTTVLTLGLGHGFSDAAAGYLIGSFSHTSRFVETGSAVLLYNILAFGGQLPAGIWLDCVGTYRKWSILASVGMMAALGLSLAHYVWAAVVLAGVSSAIYHVAGGAVTLISFPQQARFVGIFSGFGVLGLALGGWSGAMHWQGVGYLLMTGLLTIGLVLRSATFPTETQQTIFPEKPHLDNHDYVMILLLVAIALRSAVWNVIQLLHAEQYDWLLYVALAAMTGKLVGGWLADRIPWRVYALFALAIAIPSLSFGYRKLFWLLVGTGLLQSLTPISVVALQRLLPNVPATVSGATFGLAIALGGAVSFLPLDSYFSLFTQLLLLGLLTWGLYYVFLSTDKELSLRTK